MSKLVGQEQLAKLAGALDGRAKSAVAAEAERVDGIIGVASVEAAEGVEAVEATGLHKKIEDADKANAEAIIESTTFENGITTVKELGGIGAGVSLDGKSVTEILDMLLFPYVKQVMGTVSGTPNGGIYEHGNNQVITAVQAKVTKKSKPITKVELFNGSTSLAVKEGDEVKNGGTFTFSGLSVPVNSTNVQLTVKATDENGSVVSGNTGAFTFVYPYYHGVCEAGATVDEALVEGLTKDISKSGQKAYSYTTNNQCAVIAFPKSYGVLKSALDPNSFENISSFTRHEVSVTGSDGQAVAYYVYVSGAFTKSGFTYTFKY